MPTPRDQRYERLGIADTTLFVRDVAREASSLPLSVLLQTVLLLLLYLPLWPIDAIRLGTRRRSPISVSWLQAGAISIVRLAFTYVDPRVGRIFFGRDAALPLMIRRFGGEEGFSRACEHVEADHEGQRISGWWIGAKGKQSGLTILYLHGGGFTMGEPEFYLRFLDALREECPPATRIFAASYPLAPEATYHDMIESVRATWSWLSRQAGVDSKRLALAGDSAGGALALSLRLGIVNGREGEQDCASFMNLAEPALTVLLSPITNLDTPTYPDPDSSYIRNAGTDFVDADSLRYMCSSALIGTQRTRRPALLRFFHQKFLPVTKMPRRVFEVATIVSKDRIVSPYAHLDTLGRASGDTLVCWGEGEVLADDCAKLTSISDKWQALTAPSVHAWPMVLFNLGRSVSERATGVEAIGGWISEHAPADRPRIDKS